MRELRIQYKILIPNGNVSVLYQLSILMDRLVRRLSTRPKAGCPRLGRLGGGLILPRARNPESGN